MLLYYNFCFIDLSEIIILLGIITLLVIVNPVVFIQILIAKVAIFFFYLLFYKRSKTLVMKDLTPN